MPRAIWTGAITFGLVTIPVGLYSAVERKGELSFRLLHGKDQAPIDYRRFCSVEGVEVAWEDIVKGYEYERGRYVIMTEEDFARAQVAATQTIEITDFVPAGSIDFLYLDHPYYVAPAGRGGAKAYALLRDALRETKRVGVGTLVLKRREQLVAVEPAKNVLSVTTMRWATEIRSGEDLEIPARGEGWAKKEMALARQLIESLASDWEPKKYRDTYTEVLQQAIEQKLKKGHVELPRTERPPKVVSLARALEQSLRTPRKGLKHAPPRAAARPKRGAKRTAA